MDRDTKAAYELALQHVCDAICALNDVGAPHSDLAAVESRLVAALRADHEARQERLCESLVGR